MNRIRIGSCIGILLLFASIDGFEAGSLPDRLNSGQEGVVVEDVQKGFAAHRAGLQSGDILLSWERAASLPANPEPASDLLRTPFDLLELELEQAPRGEVTVFGTRGTEHLEARLSPGEWKLQTRPQLTRADLNTYEEARTEIGKGGRDEGLSLWLEVASGFRERKHHLKASWLFLKVATTARQKLDWLVADAAFDEAQNQARESGEARVLAIIKDSMADSFQDRGELEKARAIYQEAREIRLGTTSSSLGLSAGLQDLGDVAWHLGELETAESFWLQSLAIRKNQAPDSLEVASSLNKFGNLAWSRGDLKRAEEFYRRSLATRERLVPQGVEVAGSLTNLGLVAWNRGELARADRFCRRAFAIYEKLVPQSIDAARNLTHLGNIALDRGNLVQAEDYYLRASAIQLAIAPNSVEGSAALSNLGVTAR